MSWFLPFLIAVVIPLLSSEEVGPEVTCVVVNFENGLEDFDDSVGQCQFIPYGWDVGHYADIDIQGPHESSTTFIRPNALSCTSSFEFDINAEGVLEVTFYMSTRVSSEYLTFVVNEIQPTGNIVQAYFQQFDSDTPGIIDHDWNVMKFPMGSSGNYTGFVSIQHSSNKL